MYMWCVTIDGVLIGEWNDYVYTPLGTTSNYSTVPNLHPLQMTTAPAKPSSTRLYLHQPFPNNGFNSGDSSASRVHVISSQPPVQISTLTSQLTTPN
jgi:hypothetical protein